MTVNIMYGTFLNTEWQKKKFKDEISAMEWCRRHFKNIGCINNYRTGFQPISHFEIMDALRGKEN